MDAAPPSKRLRGAQEAEGAVALLQPAAELDTGFMVSGKILQSKVNPRCKVLCKTEGHAAKVKGDQVALSLIKVFEDKLTVVGSATAIYENLVAEARKKTLKQTKDEGAISQRLFEALQREFQATEDTVIGDLLVEVRNRGMNELNMVSTARGTAAAAMQSLLQDAEQVQELTSKVNKFMKDADSDDEDETWKSDKVARLRRTIEKKATSHGKALAKAIDDIPVDSPAIVDALLAIQTSTVDMPRNDMEAILEFQQKEEELIAERMKICQVEEELAAVGTELAHTEARRDEVDRVMQEQLQLVMHDRSWLEGERDKAMAEQYKERPQPDNGKDMLQQLKLRKAELEGQLTSLEEREPKDFHPPKVPPPDTTDADAAVRAANNRLNTQISNPERTKTTTIRHSFLGLWSWTSERTTSDDQDSARQQAKLDSIRRGLDQAEAARAMAVERHQREADLQRDLAQKDHDAQVASYKEAKQSIKAELKEIKEEMKRVKEAGDEALAKHADNEAERRGKFEEHRAKKVEGIEKKLKASIDEEATVRKTAAAEKHQLQLLIDQAPEKRRSKEEAIAQLYDVYNGNKAKVLKMRARVQKALSSVGGFTSALHDTLNHIRTAHASVVQAGTEAASLKPLLQNLLKLTATFSEEEESDWFIWKTELQSRAKLYNEYADQGLLLLDPQHVQLEILKQA